MKKIILISLLLLVGYFSKAQVYDYQVQAASILQADDYFVWKGDTIRKDSIAYLENHIDSIRVKYINGAFSKWIKYTQNKVTGLSFSGTTTKELSLTQIFGGTKTVTFTDLDHQSLSTSASGSTRTITISGGNSVSIDLPTSLPTPNALTMNSSGTGVASGSTFNGSAAKTISYNTIGAAPASSSGSYIQNQNASAQTANMWINGSGTFDNGHFGDIISGYGDTKIRILAVGGSTSYLQSYYANTTGAANLTITGHNNDNLPNLYANVTRSTFNGSINATSYLLNNNNLFSSLSTGKITQWTGTVLKDAPITVSESNVSVTGTLTATNISGTNTGDQTLTIGGTSAPTMALSGSNTATFIASTGLSFSQSGGTITATNTAPFPGFGTSHSLSAYGDHKHSGVYDNYQAWFLHANGSLFDSMDSQNSLNFTANTGLTVAASGNGTNNAIAYSLDLAALSTIVNPTVTYYIPSTSGSGNSKITLYTLMTTIGATAGTANLNVIRDASGDAYAHNFILSSDRRVKQNIKTLKNLDWVNGIKFVQFESKDDVTHRQRFGVIAQEVEKMNPDLVYTDAEGMKAVGYTDLIIAKLAAMEQKINDLEFELKAYKELNQIQELNKIKSHEKKYHRTGIIVN